MSSHDLQAVILHGLSYAMSSVALLFGFRALPFVVHVALDRSVPNARKSAAVGSFALLCAAAGDEFRALMLISTVGLGYYACVGLFVHWLSRTTVNPRGADNLVLFGVLAVFFLLVPATLLRPMALGTFQVLGWDLTLKAYSYVKDSGARRGGMAACLFFLLVDPSVVFPQRATPEPQRSDLAACLRVGLGLTSTFIYFLALSPLVTESTSWASRASGPTVLPSFVLLGIVHLLAAYSQHSGLASVQLGLLRLCGYRAPERYDYPLSARSPLDFWRRWNTYVGQWVNRYVYSPLALHLTRRARSARTASESPRWPSAVALLVGFGAVGLLHDVYAWGEQRRFTLALTMFFVANAAFALLWLAIEAGIARRSSRGNVGWSAARFALAGTPGRALFSVAFALLIGAST